jgi:hypothetical protein
LYGDDLQIHRQLVDSVQGKVRIPKKEIVLNGSIAPMVSGRFVLLLGWQWIVRLRRLG